MGSYTHGLFKYEIEMVEMTAQEMDQNLVKRRHVRRGSVQRLNKDMLNNLALQNNPSNHSSSNKSLEKMQSFEDKRLERKYGHVRKDLEEARRITKGVPSVDNLDNLLGSIKNPIITG